ncbi:MAG: anthranilate phosphoribosyltransferase [Candidatus Paceibacteria bacterium]|jgi:anthranilate phosphoribosyltransferase
MNAQEALKCVLAGEDLGRENMRAVLDDLFEGKADPVAIAGLLVALTSRGETRAELIGAASAMRAAMVTFEHDAPGAIDTCGTGGSGLDTFNISTCSALVAAAAGAQVIKHGNRSASSKCGSADLLEAAGVPLELSPKGARTVLDAVGITFLFAPAYHPAMRHAGPIRKALGVRTIFNLLGPLCNPGAVKRQVLGVFDPSRVADLGHVLAELGAEQALVVHGGEGADELTLAGQNSLHAIGSVPDTGWNAQALGLDVHPIQTCCGGDAQANLNSLHDLLAGEAVAARDFVLLNAAAALVVAGEAGTPLEGVQLAREAIDSGNARRKLDQWVACAQGAAKA